MECVGFCVWLEHWDVIACFTAGTREPHVLRLGGEGPVGSPVGPDCPAEILTEDPPWPLKPSHHSPWGANVHLTCEIKRWQTGLRDITAQEADISLVTESPSQVLSAWIFNLFQSPPVNMPLLLLSIQSYWKCISLWYLIPGLWGQLLADQAARIWDPLGGLCTHPSSSIKC